MRLLYFADGRSPIALSWIGYFIDNGHEVHLVSTFPCRSIDGLASLITIPVAMSGAVGLSESGAGNRLSLIRRIVPVGLRTKIRQTVAPYSFPSAAASLIQVIERIQPDLVHAMRIPYEGMVASLALATGDEPNSRLIKPPLVISVWGNDFTLHAKSTASMAAYTHRALRLAAGLHCDCHRDQRLAQELGFDGTKPQVLVPCAGGVKMDIFYPPDGTSFSESGDKNAAIKVINPRGFRSYVRNDTFFNAIPHVVEQYPNIQFICPGMRGEGQAENRVKELGIKDSVTLLPTQNRQQLADLFRSSQITLSITNHDGTPNTLVEALACGCFPIAGDIESLREWITPGENGILVDPSDPQALAQAVLQAIAQPELRQAARNKNIQMVLERAEYGMCMGMVADWYSKVIADRKSGN